MTAALTQTLMDCVATAALAAVIAALMYHQEIGAKLTQRRRRMSGEAVPADKQCRACDFYQARPGRRDDFCMRGGITRARWSCANHVPAVPVGPAPAIVSAGPYFEATLAYGDDDTNKSHVVISAEPFAPGGTPIVSLKVSDSVGDAILFLDVDEASEIWTALGHAIKAASGRPPAPTVLIHHDGAAA